MRTTDSIFRRCLLLSALLAAVAHPVAAEDPPVRFDAVLGGQTVNDLGSGEARFQEFRDVPDGFVFEFGRFEWVPSKALNLSLTAQDVAQNDQRYDLGIVVPGLLTFKASYVEIPRLYATGARALWSGLGSGRLTIDEAFRQGAEAAAGPPTAPFASPDLKTYMEAAFASASPFEIGTKRKDLGGNLDFNLAPSLTLSLLARNENNDGTKPIGFGTYIRRQALSGVPGTGAGNFWRESVEARGSELLEPVTYKTTEIGATLTWAAGGHSAQAGWFGSRFRNDITSLSFDNPFEASPGRASASIFDPKSDQEPPAPNGNNTFRGLYARSAIALWPNNDYDRFFGNVSVKIGATTRQTATVAGSNPWQDEPKVARALKQGLEAEGYAVTLAHSGEEGFFVGSSEPFDVILLDRMLPGREGLEVLAALRRRGILAPVLVLTAREYELLEYLVRHKGSLVSREMLAREVWKEPDRCTPLDNVIDVHVTRLRKKVDSGHPLRIIHTVRGVGFIVKEGEA